MLRDTDKPIGALIGTVFPGSRDTYLHSLLLGLISSTRCPILGLLNQKHSVMVPDQEQEQGARAIKSVAVIGCGPAGAISIDALMKEDVFDIIKVFERREKPGGCWFVLSFLPNRMQHSRDCLACINSVAGFDRVPDPEDTKHRLPDLDKIANRTADEPVKIPPNLPTWAPRCSQYRFSETSIYPALETNIAADAMEYSQEPIPKKRSAWSIQKHGADTPFRHHSTVQQYIEDLVHRNGYDDLVKVNTTVERVQKRSSRGGWRLILREEFADRDQDYWWTEDFDAVLIATGHYTVPFIPHIDGLAEFADTYPGSVEHTKSVRLPQDYRNKVRVSSYSMSIISSSQRYHLESSHCRRLDIRSRHGGGIGRCY